ncbi:GCG_CRPN prefix-to-repeats domain-containing protein [Bradyrhizobium jicamae]|uniref:GCG_CRPN prefix-to-repeats domain-containing protein n=1 Tax=Bradyrhizobium jicamae TaxID=280332 RepID=UPI0009FA735D
MMIRLACCAACLVVYAVAEPALAADGCGVGCHSTSEGACVRDGWQQGLPVRNVCPATSRPAPPCGPYHRWSRRSMMCIPT